MPDPAEWLDVARLLCAGSAPPSDAQLRRAVSTAYYAVFHKILGLAASRFMGPGQENAAGYKVLYRSFDHTRVREVCEALDKPELNNAYKRILGRRNVSVVMRDFAEIFVMLQAVRHHADYDPGYQLSQTDVSDIIYLAENAILSLDAAEPAELADVLALMMVKTRG